MNEEPIETTAVVVSDTPVAPTLFNTSDPVEIVERARDVANALKEVIRAQGLISNIQGREYVRCEGWTLLGTMLGVSPVTVWTREKENGWEARVEARRGDMVVGAAEAECTRDEKTWKTRDSYALRSMAQTRAVSKALRMPLGFVVTLAGFEATPAEEMMGIAPEGSGMARATTPLSLKQSDFIRLMGRRLAGKMHQSEAEALMEGIGKDFPTAWDATRKKLIIGNLTAGEAGTVITKLKEALGE